MKRREFIILTGVGATGATMLSACGHPENKLIPALIPDNEYVPGVDYWKASACSMCDAGCGIVVRAREHKANKIEGNPLHPTNRGALCARGQAALETLYHPDRIKGPMRRTGERGSGQFEAISWDEAIKILADKFREINAQGRAASSVAVTSDAKAVTAHVLARFMGAIKASSILTRPLFNEIAADNSYLESYGSETAHFDLSSATYLLSFGARFLETWGSPVMQSLAYGEFRNARGKARGRFVQVEPRMSLTAANADEWLPAAIGSQGTVALSIAHAIIREGSARIALSPEFAKALEEFAPEKIAARVDLPAEKIVRIAHEFAASERPLAIGSGDQRDMQRINLLNTLVNNLNKKGGVILPRRSNEFYGPLESLRPKDRFNEMSLSDLPKAIGSPDLSVLLIHRVNPVFIFPELRDQISRLPFIASFSPFMDETTELADLILPDHSSLESWDINSSQAASGQLIVTLTQPAVKPEFDTRQTADALLALSRELGGDAAAALPFPSAEAIIRQAASEMSKRRGSIAVEKPEDFWKAFVERGVWVEESQINSDASSALTAAASTEAKLPTPAALSAITNQDPQLASDSEFPLSLMVYEHPSFKDGSFANLSRLQELPDPMTSVMWGSWVEINPKTANALGIADGDLVEVSAPHGSLRAPAVVYPAIRPDVIAMPFGQGHASYGRYAKGRGASATSLLASAQIETPVRARINRVAGEAGLIRFGTDLLHKIENDRSR